MLKFILSYPVLIIALVSCSKAWECECTGKETTITYRYRGDGSIEREKVSNDISSRSDIQDTEKNAELRCSNNEINVTDSRPIRDFQSGYEYEKKMTCELKRKI